MPGLPTVFLDRDGVLNRNRDDYVKSWAEFEWLPGAVPSLRRLRAAGYALVVVTNQAMVGRGRATLEALADLHARMVEEAAGRGARLDAILFCPHVPDDGCGCRKPAPGMILQGARLVGADLARSWMVGDRESDLEAGRRAGVAHVAQVGPERPLWKVVAEIVSG